jgi:hypothetical protein
VARRFLRARPVVAVALLLGVAGCALVRPRPPAGEPATAAALLADVAAQREARTALRARARLRTGLAGLWTREAILVRRPDAVRVDVLSPFGLALALGVAGRELWVWPASQGVRYDGDASPENLARFLGAPIAVSDLVDVLMGLPPARVPAAPPVARRTAGNEWEVVIPLPDGVQTLWFDVDTRQLTRAAEQRGEGAVLRVAFGDYQDGFPHTLEVESPALRSSAKLAYDAVEVNPSLPESVFTPPPAPRVVPLEAAAPSAAPQS